MTSDYGAVLSVVNANDPIQRIKSSRRNLPCTILDIRQFMASVKQQCVIIMTNLTQSIKTVILKKGPILNSYTKICFYLLSPDDCILPPCCVRYIAVFSPNVD